MASIKEKAAETGSKVAEAAKAAGHKIAEGAEKAVDWVKDKTNLGTHPSACDTAKMADATTIREHMDVLTSCGCKVGKVDRVEGDAIKLTKDDSSDGQHHLVPKNWIARIDEHVHLNKNAEEVAREWKTAGCCA